MSRLRPTELNHDTIASYGFVPESKDNRRTPFVFVVLSPPLRRSSSESDDRGWPRFAKEVPHAAGHEKDIVLRRIRPKSLDSNVTVEPAGHAVLVTQIPAGAPVSLQLTLIVEAAGAEAEI